MGWYVGKVRDTGRQVNVSKICKNSDPEMSKTHVMIIRTYVANHGIALDTVIVPKKWAQGEIELDRSQRFDEPPLEDQYPYVCGKCSGNGEISAFKKIENGICFRCDGSGFEPTSKIFNKKTKKKA